MFALPAVIALTLLPANYGSGGRVATVSDVLALYKKYVSQPGTLTVNIKLEVASGGKTSTGTESIVLGPTRQGPVAQKWDLKQGSFDLHFVTDSRVSLEWSNAAKKYDRHLVRNGLPYGRIIGGPIIGYPIEIALRDLGTVFSRSAQLRETTPTYYLVGQDDKGMTGERHALAKVAKDGRLIDLKIDEKGQTGERVVDLEFTSYSFSKTAASYPTDPTVGLTALRLPEDVDVLTTEASIPAVKVNGHQTSTTLAKLSKTGLTLMVFTEDALPSSLEKTLQTLSKSARPIVVSSSEITSRFPVYVTSQKGLDEAGVASTPQFYLVRNGKLVQAWMGWDATKADFFMAQIKAAIKGDLPTN